MSNTVEREFGWDDTIQRDGADFVLLPEGDYPFTVEGFSRGRHNGSAKLPPCNKAELKIRVGDPFTPGRSTVVEHNLFLHSKCEGLLCAFFTSIGLRKHGEELRMNWNEVTGATGRCHLTVDTWVGRDGNERKNTKIDRFLEPEPAPVQTVMTPPAAKRWEQGKF